MRQQQRWRTGRRAEGLALEHLCARGLRCLARNFRCREGELDLVMQEHDTLVFVEVRARRGRDETEQAAASVDLYKQRRLAKAALYYLQRHRPDQDVPCRMDVMLVIGPDQAAPRLHWIRAAYEVEAAP